MKKCTILVLAVLLVGCVGDLGHVPPDTFKKTFDECYANIPVTRLTQKDEPLLHIGRVRACYRIAIKLHKHTRATKNAD